MMEFALVLPVLLIAGGYGVELSRLAITTMRISQIALTTADNVSRIGVGKDTQSPYQVQEGEINDVLRGTQMMGASLKLTTFGRVTISSLENVQRDFTSGTDDTQPVQRLHWQRCVGVRTGIGTPSVPNYDSSYGQATPLTTAGTDSTSSTSGPNSAGLGSSPVVTAPANSGVMFVEVNYQYQPLFGTMFYRPQILHFTASFIVRDNRDFSQLFNTATALGTPTRSTCDVAKASVPTL
jgi:Flp pilus assembly protein TadG